MVQTAFETFPVLSTERCILRQLDLEDAAGIFTLRSSEQVNEFVNRPRAESVSDAINFINKIMNLQQKNETFYWAITTKENNQFAGTFTIWNIDVAKERGEIGYELLPEMQGKGLMQEVLPAVLDFAFTKMQLKNIEGWVMEGNIRSIALLKKFGFERAEAEKKEADMKEVIYSLSREKWKILVLPTNM
jgi:ribosomal-protein-alanine N-acetyltransferase